MNGRLDPLHLWADQALPAPVAPAPDQIQRSPNETMPFYSSWNLPGDNWSTTGGENGTDSARLWGSAPQSEVTLGGLPQQQLHRQYQNVQHQQERSEEPLSKRRPSHTNSEGSIPRVEQQQQTQLQLQQHQRQNYQQTHNGFYFPQGNADGFSLSPMSLQNANFSSSTPNSNSTPHSRSRVSQQSMAVESQHSSSGRGHSFFRSQSDSDVDVWRLPNLHTATSNDGSHVKLNDDGLWGKDTRSGGFGPWLEVQAPNTTAAVEEGTFSSSASLGSLWGETTATTATASTTSAASNGNDLQRTFTPASPPLVRPGFADLIPRSSLQVRETPIGPLSAHAASPSVALEEWARPSSAMSAHAEEFSPAGLTDHPAHRVSRSISSTARSQSEQLHKQHAPSDFASFERPRVSMSSENVPMSFDGPPTSTNVASLWGPPPSHHAPRSDGPSPVHFTLPERQGSAPPLATWSGAACESVVDALVRSTTVDEYRSASMQLRSLVTHGDAPGVANALLAKALTESLPQLDASSKRFQLLRIVEVCQLLASRYDSTGEHGMKFFAALRSAVARRWQQISFQFDAPAVADADASALQRLRFRVLDFVRLLGELYMVTCVDAMLVISLVATRLCACMQSTNSIPPSPHVRFISLQALCTLLLTCGAQLESSARASDLISVLDRVFQVLHREVLVPPSHDHQVRLQQQMQQLIDERKQWQFALVPPPTGASAVSASAISENFVSLIARHMWDFCVALDLTRSHVHGNTCTQFNNCYQEWLRCLRLLAKPRGSSDHAKKLGQNSHGSLEKEEQQQFQADLVYALFLPLTTEVVPTLDEAVSQQLELYCHEILQYTTNSSAPARNWLIQDGCLMYQDSQDQPRGQKPLVIGVHTHKHPRRMLCVLHNRGFNINAVDSTRDRIRAHLLSRSRFRVHSVPPPVPEPNAVWQSEPRSGLPDTDRAADTQPSPLAQAQFTLCKYWKNQQVCKNGKNCRFLHGDSVPNAQKTAWSSDDPSTEASAHASTPMAGERFTPSELDQLVVSHVIRILQTSQSASKAKGAQDPPLVAQVGFLLRRSLSQTFRGSRGSLDGATSEALRKYLDTADGRLLFVLKRHPQYFKLEDTNNTGGHTVTLVSLPADFSPARQDAQRSLSLARNTNCNDDCEREVVNLLRTLLHRQQQENQGTSEPLGLLVAPLGAALRRQTSLPTQLFLDTQDGRLMSVLKRNTHMFAVLDPKQNGGHVVCLRDPGTTS